MMEESCECKVRRLAITDVGYNNPLSQLKEKKYMNKIKWTNLLVHLKLKHALAVQPMKLI